MCPSHLRRLTGVSGPVLLVLVLISSCVPLSDALSPLAGAVAQPVQAPILQNPNFECAAGFDVQAGVSGATPHGWTTVLLEGAPTLNSTRLQFTGGCSEEGFAERIEGSDSLVFLAEDIETPPEPGKPFDAALYQQTTVVAGEPYSLSGWLVSLCGGSFSNPNDCPADYYMAKMLGVDPTGGVDPLADTVVWDEDRRNFVESRWVNLRLVTTPVSDTLTVFVRVRSPFRWHGNHAFADAISLVRAPTAHLVDLPATITTTQAFVQWEGDLGPDIPAIPASSHQLVFDLQYRTAPTNAWADWLTGQPAGSALFAGAACNRSITYEFRVRARAEQPEGVPGAWPPHRYLGARSAPATVSFTEPLICMPRGFLPLIVGEAY